MVPEWGGMRCYGKGVAGDVTALGRLVMLRHLPTWSLRGAWQSTGSPQKLFIATVDQESAEVHLERLDEDGICKAKCATRRPHKSDSGFMGQCMDLHT